MPVNENVYTVETADEVTDIEYRSTDGQSLLGRLHRPKGSKKVPLLIEVHGGGWRRADRTVAVRMPVSSPASFSSRSTSASCERPHSIIRRNQNVDSRASLRAMEFFDANSRREYADLASAEFAPTEVPASSS